MEGDMAFIRYITKSNGQEYASLADTVRSDGQVKQEYLGNLGRVIDKETGIFRSRERGLFRYTLEDGFCDLPTAYAETLDASSKKERLILVPSQGLKCELISPALSALKA
jgi:hypothetical protein